MVNKTSSDIAIW